MSNFNKGVLDHYDVYEILRRATKHIKNLPVNVSEIKPNQTHFKIGKTDIELDVPPHKMRLEVEVKRNEFEVFHFKVFCDGFTNCPLVRYDSSGAAHRNRDAPLSEASIDTPHYHYFKSDGFEYAYQTPDLTDKSNAIKLKDVTFSFQFFCAENNLSYKPVSKVINIFGDELPFDSALTDPLEGIRF